MDCTSTIVASNDHIVSMDPTVKPFVSSSRILGGSHHIDMASYSEQFTHVQAVGVGRLNHGGHDLWDASVVHGCRVAKDNRILDSTRKELLFADLDDLPGILGLAPKEIHKVGTLPDCSGCKE